MCGTLNAHCIVLVAGEALSIAASRQNVEGIREINSNQSQSTKSSIRDSQPIAKLMASDISEQRVCVASGDGNRELPPLISSVG